MMKQVATVNPNVAQPERLSCACPDRDPRRDELVMRYYQHRDGGLHGPFHVRRCQACGGRYDDVHRAVSDD